MAESTSDDVRQAVQILRDGGLVAFATETVYGLGADATNASAVRRIFEAKGRPTGNPLIVHVADVDRAREFAGDWPSEAEKLARQFWPGPLTLVVAKGKWIVPEVTAGLETMGVRCPDHPMALELLRQFAGPVAAPSANRSNRVSPTTAEHVQRELGKRVDMILDGGPCRVGIESTVVDLVSRPPAILRLGAVGHESLQKIVGPFEVRAGIAEKSAAMSPGQQAVHYSPVAPTFRFDETDWERIERIFFSALGRQTIFLIIRNTELARRLRDQHLRERFNPDFIIEMPAIAGAYARELYAALHRADELHPEMIWIQAPPPGNEWDAIRDRIIRASRPASAAQ
jgi:L-threonylcarbamoyladenylate synthase